MYLQPDFGYKKSPISAHLEKKLNAALQITCANCLTANEDHM